jgi:hypothetical protein
LQNNDVHPDCTPNDDTRAEGTAVDIIRQKKKSFKKRPLRLVKDTDDDEKKIRGKKRQKFIDLADVPPQSPILKSSSKDGASKYKGVCFNKASNKWQAQVMIDGKNHHIGFYDNEEKAAIDYARVDFKYKRGKVRGGRTHQQRKQKFIDLTDVPPQSPILSNIVDGSSKYQGVAFHKAKGKWQAIIMIDGKNHFLGHYDNEDEAAIDYARAVSKYKAESTGGKMKQKFIDLTDVPPQSPILKSSSKVGASKYKGVSFKKENSKWQARMTIDGKRQSIGVYENEEEAAIDYARAMFKYSVRVTQKVPSTRRCSGSCVAV